jgi:hypothetical protein
MQRDDNCLAAPVAVVAASLSVLVSSWSLPSLYVGPLMARPLLWSCCLWWWSSGHHILVSVMILAFKLVHVLVIPFVLQRVLFVGVWSLFRILAWLLPVVVVVVVVVVAVAEDGIHHI